VESHGKRENSSAIAETIQTIQLWIMMMMMMMMTMKIQYLLSILSILSVRCVETEDRRSLSTLVTTPGCSNMSLPLYTLFECCDS
jgi:hypothetical protein